MDIDSIYRLYFRDVFLFLQGLTHNEALAEELTQETFFKALDGLKDYDDRQDVRAWLFTVARNAYYSHCRRTKRTAPLEDAETAPADTPDIAQLLVDQDAAFTVLLQPCFGRAVFVCCAPAHKKNTPAPLGRGCSAVIGNVRWKRKASFAAGSWPGSRSPGPMRHCGRRSARCAQRAARRIPGG